MSCATTTTGLYKSTNGKIGKMKRMHVGGKLCNDSSIIVIAYANVLLIRTNVVAACRVLDKDASHRNIH